MKEYAESLKWLMSAMWSGLISWAIWGALMNLYHYKKTGYFKWSIFFLALIMWGFVWSFFDWGTFSGVAWAMSMKIFDLMYEKWDIFIKNFINTIFEKKYWVKLFEENEWKCWSTK